MPFATHAVQSEKLPLDIVKEFLHQKNIGVTEYYTVPTSQQITLTDILVHRCQNFA